MHSEYTCIYDIHAFSISVSLSSAFLAADDIIQNFYLSVNVFIRCTAVHCVFQPPALSAVAVYIVRVSAVSAGPVILVRRVAYHCFQMFVDCVAALR